MRDVELLDLRAPLKLLQDLLFAVGVGGLGRVLVARDRLLGRPGVRVLPAGATRLTIESGRNGLDAVLMVPEGARVQAAVIVCPGIGERVEHWLRAQELLAGRGVASLVFNYSGMGRSGGRVSVGQCERDAIAAAQWMRVRFTGVPRTLLGFSLGSGIAAAVTRRAYVERVVLCAAYTSFREAACALGLPGWMRSGLPDVWRSGEALRRCGVPVLIVQGQRDRLFPLWMGGELARVCGGTVMVVSGMEHADLHAEPRMEQWGPVVEWLLGKAD